MKRIYCDNASTSFPKAPGLGKAMARHIDFNSYNISRGGYDKAYDLEEQIIETREKICRMFGHDDTKSVIFTPGATAGLNMVINGVLQKGDHVITTSMEHNAVVRPLFNLEKGGVSWSKARCDEKGNLIVSDIRRLIRKETKMILLTHGSNVCGTMMPIETIGRMCRDRGILFAVDASQTAGSVCIDMRKCFADAVIMPGHKGLMGPQGIGVMMLSKCMAEIMKPTVLGGTGSASDKEKMPDFLPDKFQPGTLNIPGIIGLKHAVDFIVSVGQEKISKKKRDITGMFIDELCGIEGVKLVGMPKVENRCAVVSVDFLNRDNGEVAFELENHYGIMTRCGLHCAPHAHKTLGTFPHGTVRFSFGYFNTEEDVKYVIDAVNELSRA